MPDRMQLISLALALCFVSGVKADFELTILHTNDVHARFEEFSEVCKLTSINSKLRSAKYFKNNSKISDEIDFPVLQWESNILTGVVTIATTANTKTIPHTQH